MSTETDMNHPPAITLSRSLGSGGTEVGLLVAQELGWRFCDRRILRRAAQDLGVSATTLSGEEERPCGFLDQLLSLTVCASPEVPYVPVLEMPVYSADLFEEEGRIMRELADAAPSVLVGRGGFIVLKGRPNTFHVRIQASLDHRIHDLLARGKAPDEEAAREAIQASDRDRAAFFRKVAHVDWSDSDNFDLVLDAGEASLLECARVIVREAGIRLNGLVDRAPHGSGA